MTLPDSPVEWGLIILGGTIPSHLVGIFVKRLFNQKSNRKTNRYDPRLVRSNYLSERPGGGARIDQPFQTNCVPVLGHEMHGCVATLSTHGISSGIE